MKSNRNQATDGEAKAKPEVIKLGLDLHARQVTECRQLDGSTPKPAQKWDPWKLLGQIETWTQAGIRVYSCYEAGACGYWYHRELVKCGAINFVVAPQPLETGCKGQKTDRLDALALLRHLDSYLGGNRDAMSVVAVPTPEQEQQRSVVRYREQLLRDRRRAEARGRALVLTQAVIAPRGWWRPRVWPDFNCQLPQWTIPQVEYWQGRALAADAKDREVRLQLEKMLNRVLPVGVGALSWIVLEQELRGWDRFHNRRHRSMASRRAAATISAKSPAIPASALESIAVLELRPKNLVYF